MLAVEFDVLSFRKARKWEYVFTSSSVNIKYWVGKTETKYTNIYIYSFFG